MRLKRTSVGDRRSCWIFTFTYHFTRSQLNESSGGTKKAQKTQRSVDKKQHKEGILVHLSCLNEGGAAQETGRTQNLLYTHKRPEDKRQKLDKLGKEQVITRAGNTRRQGASNIIFSFFFQLFPSGVATADHLTHPVPPYSLPPLLLHQPSLCPLWGHSWIT